LSTTFCSHQTNKNTSANQSNIRNRNQRRTSQFNRLQEVVTFIEAGRELSFNGGELLRSGEKETRKGLKRREWNCRWRVILSLASEGRVVVVWWSEGGSGFIGSRPEGGPGRISTTGGSAGVSVGAKEGARKEDSIA
jgi:hypothetical protein